MAHGQERREPEGGQSSLALHYQSVRIFTDQQLGSGSYGMVCRAQCDQLPCAAKLIHQNIVSRENVRKFLQECRFLSDAKHPNIVQFLGTYEDPESKRPVLLMELMDENLTTFLGRSPFSLAFHVQANVCHDVSLALDYLHSNDIIHRDLSSNNVLMIGDRRAKVTDFGMSKITALNPQTLAALTQCPGSLPFMPPEALADPPVYSKKLDSFSFGVVTLHVLTRRFPNPGPATREVEHPDSPSGCIKMPVLETERRRSDIALVEPTHRLLSVALTCLCHQERERPTSHELCRRMAEIKTTSLYSQSVQEATEEVEQLRGKVEELQRRLRATEQEFRARVDPAQGDLGASSDVPQRSRERGARGQQVVAPRAAALERELTVSRHQVDALLGPERTGDDPPQDQLERELVHMARNAPTPSLPQGQVGLAEAIYELAATL